VHTTVRISRSTHELLREISEATGDTMTDIVDHAVREYQRQKFWADYNKAYESVQADSSSWAEFQGEVELWDSTLADGLRDQTDGTDRASSPIAG